jgi:Protein of unknown function (DUF2849)
MSKISFHVEVLTANRLRDGAVVFLNFDGDWVPSLLGVVIARSPDEARGLAARGVHDAARNLVVDPYLVEMREVAGALLPLRQRERVRLSGPSILDDVPGYLAPPLLGPQPLRQEDNRAAATADRNAALRQRGEPALSGAENSVQAA